MEKGNVLVIGNSGVGKSTLINAVLGDNVALTGHGTKGTTTELEIFENDEIPFRIIDSVGFEPSRMKAMHAINSVKKWSKESVKSGKEDTEINLIWFCVDGTSSKLFPETIKHLLRATKMWKTVPIVVVITKSFSEPDREKNIIMVKEAFFEEKRQVAEIIPVVASTFTLNTTAFAGPEGISELIEVTNTLMPEGIKAGAYDVNQYKFQRKRLLAHSVVASTTTAATIVGAIPIPIADSMVLAPIEIGQVNALAKIYEINNDEESKKMFSSILEAGAVSVAAKNALSLLKAVPGINIGASVLNALVAGAFVAALGEGSIFIFEKVYTGEKTVGDIDWMKKIMEAKMSSQFMENIDEILKWLTEKGNTKDISKITNYMLKKMFTENKVTN